MIITGPITRSAGSTSRRVENQPCRQSKLQPSTPSLNPSFPSTLPTFGTGNPTPTPISLITVKKYVHQTDHVDAVCSVDTCSVANANENGFNHATTSSQQEASRIRRGDLQQTQERRLCRVRRCSSVIDWDALHSRPYRRVLYLLFGRTEVHRIHMDLTHWNVHRVRRRD
jgi:hypothetical protein